MDEINDQIENFHKKESSVIQPRKKDNKKID